MAEVIRKPDIRYPVIIQEVDKSIYGMDENGNFNLLYIDTDGAQKIKGDIGFVASVDIVIEPSVNKYAVSPTISVTSYPGTAQAVFGFTSRDYVVVNDSTQSAYYSFNGTTDFIEIKAGEQHPYVNSAATQIFLRVASGSAAMRVIAT